MVAALLATAVLGCAQQSEAGFPGAYGNRDNLVVGPMAWLFARAGDGDGRYRDVYRWKQPMLVRPGHVVKLRIGRTASAFAGLAFGPYGDGWDFEGTRSVITFRSCSRARAKSTTGGRRVTFWSGGIVLTRPSACVPLEIRIDGGPVRHRTLAYGKARC